MRNTTPHLDDVILSPAGVPGYDTAQQFHQVYKLDDAPELLRTKLLPEMERQDRALIDIGRQAEKRLASEAEANMDDADSDDDAPYTIEDRIGDIDKTLTTLAEQVGDLRKQWGSQAKHRFWFPSAGPIRTEEGNAALKEANAALA